MVTMTQTRTQPPVQLVAAISAAAVAGVALLGAAFAIHQQQASDTPDRWTLSEQYVVDAVEDQCGVNGVDWTVEPERQAFPSGQVYYWLGAPGGDAHVFVRAVEPEQGDPYVLDINCWSRI